MTRLPIRLFALLLATMASGTAVAQQAGARAFSNGIAAQVEDRIITLEELRQEMSLIVPQIRARSSSRSDFDRRLAEATREVLQELIDRILIIREFEQEEYQIPQSFLDNAFDEHLTKNFNGDRGAFLEYLKAQGKSELEFRRDLRERMIVDFMRSQKMRSRTSVSPARIKEYYEEHKDDGRFYQEEGVKLRMIMLKPIAGSTDELMMQQAEAIITKLEQGEDFAALASKYSQDEKADEGGDWDWIGRDMLKEDLTKVAFSLEPGAYSQPVKSGTAIYILKVEDKREATIKDLDKVSGEIEESIAFLLARQATDRWLERLREKAFIRIYLNDTSLFALEAEPSKDVKMNLGQE